MASGGWDTAGVRWPSHRFPLHGLLCWLCGDDPGQSGRCRPRSSPRLPPDAPLLRPGCQGPAGPRAGAPHRAAAGAGRERSGDQAAAQAGRGLLLQPPGGRRPGAEAAGHHRPLQAFPRARPTPADPQGPHGPARRHHRTDRPGRCRGRPGAALAVPGAGRQRARPLRRQQRPDRRHLPRRHPPAGPDRHGRQTRAAGPGRAGVRGLLPQRLWGVRRRDPAAGRAPGAGGAGGAQAALPAAGRGAGAGAAQGGSYGSGGPTYAHERRARASGP